MFFGHSHLLLSLVLVSPESDRARDLYARQRYSEAAEIFEQLWAAGKSSSDLFNAALARQAAGDLTQANLYFRMISGRSDLDPEERTEAAEHVGWLRQVLTAIVVEIRPGRALGPEAELHLGRGDDLLTIALADLEETARPSSEPTRSWTLYLEPGEWTLELLPRSARSAYNAVGSLDSQRILVPPASASALTLTVVFAITPQLAPLEIAVGKAAAERGVDLRLIDPLGIHDHEVSTGRPELSLTLPTGSWGYEVLLGKHPWLLRPRGPTLAGELEVFAGGSPTRQSFALELEVALDAERGRKNFATTSAGIALAFAALGGGLLAGGTKVKLEESFDNSRDVDKVLDLGSAGSFFVGSAAGLLGTSLGTVLGAGRRVWLTELALGSTTAVTAAAWYGLSRRSLPESGPYTEEITAMHVTMISDRQPLLYTSTALIGLGAGLALGAGASFLLDRAQSKKAAKRANKKSARGAQVSFQSSLSGGGFHVSF